MRLALRLAAALMVGAGIGLASLLLTWFLVGWTRWTEDAAYCLAGGIGCLTAGGAIYLSCRRIEGRGSLWRTLVALLLGTGVTLFTLSAFEWGRETFFPYEQYPRHHYVLGEVGGFLAPGVGLLTGGTTAVLLCFAGTGAGRRSPSGYGRGVHPDAVPRLRLTAREFTARLALALILGTGVGLSSVAIVYVLLGRDSETADIAGYVAGGLGGLAVGVTMALA